MRRNPKIAIAVAVFGLLMIGWGSAAALRAETAAAPAGDRYDNWQLECKGPQACGLVQRLVEGKDKEKRFILAAIIVMVTDKGGVATPHLRFLTPEGVDLQTGVVANIDKGQQFKLPFLICGGGRCIADGVLSDDLLKRFQHGKVMAVAYRPAGAKPVIRPLQLFGFPVGYQALQDRLKSPGGKH